MIIRESTAVRDTRRAQKRERVKRTALSRYEERSLPIR